VYDFYLQKEIIIVSCKIQRGAPSYGFDDLTVEFAFWTRRRRSGCGRISRGNPERQGSCQQSKQASFDFHDFEESHLNDDFSNCGIVLN